MFFKWNSRRSGFIGVTISELISSTRPLVGGWSRVVGLVKLSRLLTWWLNLLMLLWSGVTCTSSCGAWSVDRVSPCALVAFMEVLAVGFCAPQGSGVEVDAVA